MAKQPLGEVFGFPIDNLNPNATRFRKHQLCPFGNIVPNCTKDKAKDPLGVCSVISDNDIIITCPIRFRQNWIIAEDAAGFFFQENAKWTTLTEVRLPDKNGRSAGNIDVVLAAYDSNGTITDFGALEVQAVYISGNMRKPFEYYMGAPKSRTRMNWEGKPNYPRPDYLSSSRKRLLPQLIFKGNILNRWRKKIAVALNGGFFDTLPQLREVDETKAEIAWFIYDLKFNKKFNTYDLTRNKVVYTGFRDPLKRELLHLMQEMLEISKGCFRQKLMKNWIL